MNEKQFENKLKKALSNYGIYRLGDPHENQKGWYVKNWGGGQFVPAGIPDLQIVVGDVSLNVELKSETGKPSPMQLQKLKQINDCGGHGILLRPRDLNKFLLFVETIIKDYESRDYYVEF